MRSRDDPAQSGGFNVVGSILINELKETFILSRSTLDESFWEVEIPDDPRFQVAKKADAFVERFWIVSAAFQDETLFHLLTRCSFMQISTEASVKIVAASADV